MGDLAGKRDHLGLQALLFGYTWAWKAMKRDLGAVAV
jgi:hypothetical protein